MIWEAIATSLAVVGLVLSILALGLAVFSLYQLLTARKGIE